MSLDGLDHWITKDTWYDENLGPDPEDWAEAEEREECTRAMRRMSDDDCPYTEAEIERSQALIASILGPDEVKRLLEEDQPPF
jgi:hypothetical protein